MKSRRRWRRLAVRAERRAYRPIHAFFLPGVAGDQEENGLGASADGPAGNCTPPGESPVPNTLHRRPRRAAHTRTRGNVPAIATDDGDERAGVKRVLPVRAPASRIEPNRTPRVRRVGGRGERPAAGPRRNSSAKALLPTPVSCRTLPQRFRHALRNRAWRSFCVASLQY